VSDALSALATAYNTALGAIDAQRGDSDGALNGQAVVSDLSRALRGIATYSDSGSIDGLKSLGLELQNDGTLKFNQFEFLAADLTNSAGVAIFLGSSTKSGFLKSASAALKTIQATSTGILSIAETTLSQQQNKIEDTIAAQQARVDELTERLQRQMAAADALISSMEQQYNQISTMLDSMRVASEQYS
jgi:flagellar capping protein FliD